MSIAVMGSPMRRTDLLTTNNSSLCAEVPKTPRPTQELRLRGPGTSAPELRWAGDGKAGGAHFSFREFGDEEGDGRSHRSERREGAPRGGRSRPSDGPGADPGRGGGGRCRALPDIGRRAASV